MADAIQQQLIAARKNQILDAASTIFAERGFHSTTTKLIARQAGISEGTIYNYFDNKSDLLLGIFERMKANVLHDSPPIASQELDLRSLVRVLLFQPMAAMQQDNFALFRIVISEIMVNEELRDLYYRQILEPTFNLAEEQVTRLLAQRGLDSSAIALSIRVIAGMVMGIMLQQIMGDPLVVADREQLTHRLADLIVDGLESSLSSAKKEGSA